MQEEIGTVDHIQINQIIMKIIQFEFDEHHGYIIHDRLQIDVIIHVKEIHIMSKIQNLAERVDVLYVNVLICRHIYHRVL